MMEAVKVRLEKEELEQMNDLRQQWFETFGVRLSASGFIAAMYRLGLKSGINGNSKETVPT